MKKMIIKGLCCACMGCLLCAGLCVDKTSVDLRQIESVRAETTTSAETNETFESVDANIVAMSTMSNLLINEATTHLGERYVFGGRTPGRFDCSGFVEYCYKTALGITPKRVIGHRAGGAQYQYNGCIKIDKSELVPGDLVFFGSSPKSIAHVGIYVAPDKMLNAANSEDGVCYKSISKFIPRFVGYGRVEGFGMAQPTENSDICL